MGTFVIGEVGEYVPQQVAENDFLNQKLENDTYGIYYSVQFEGDAETYLVQAKKAPMVGQAEWGMIEMSKSGKSKRFKRVKQDGQGTSSPQSSSDKPFLKDASTVVTDVWKTLVHIQGVPENATQFTKFFQTVKEHTDELSLMIDKARSGTEQNPSAKESQELLPSTSGSATGYEKARQTREQFDDGDPGFNPDEE